MPGIATRTSELERRFVISSHTAIDARYAPIAPSIEHGDWLAIRRRLERRELTQIRHLAGKTLGEVMSDAPERQTAMLLNRLAVYGVALEP